MHDKNEIYLECDCHSHALHIEKDPCFEKEDPIWYGSFWMRGYDKNDWKWKWRIVWEVIKTGRPYGDEVVLRRKHLQELLEYIQEQLKQTKS